MTTSNGSAVFFYSRQWLYANKWLNQRSVRARAYAQARNTQLTMHGSIINLNITRSLPALLDTSTLIISPFHPKLEPIVYHLLQCDNKIRVIWVDRTHDWVSPNPLTHLDQGVTWTGHMTNTHLLIGRIEMWDRPSETKRGKRKQGQYHPEVSIWIFTITDGNVVKRLRRWPSQMLWLFTTTKLIHWHSDEKILRIVLIFVSCQTMNYESNQTTFRFQLNQATFWTFH